MFEFFIALFGGLFYGGKFSSDRADIKTSQRRFESQNKLNESIAQQVKATQELSNEIESRMQSGEHLDDICEELKDDFWFIYGDNTDMHKLLSSLGRASNKDYHNYSFFSPYYFAYHLLLSHAGEVSWMTYMYGFELGGAKELPVTSKFCQRIEYNLQQNGFDLRLLVQPGTRNNEHKWSPYAKQMRFEHQLNISKKDIEKARLW